MLISVHFPKTGGSTFKDMLDKIFGKNIFYDYGDQYTFVDVYQPSLVIRLARYMKNRKRYRSKLLPSDKCIHGHFRATKYINAFSSTHLITWVRDPIDRVVSHYFYWKRNPDYLHSICRLLHKKNLSLEEFARIDVMRNLMTRYLDNINLNCFDFIGVVEYFDKMSNYFFEYFDIKPVSVKPRNMNLNKPVSERYNLDEPTRKLIRNLNDNDLRIYDLAMKKAKETGII